jgi:hypothetical protein
VYTVLANPMYIAKSRLARAIYIYVFFGREITKCTDLYGVYVRFWPTLYIP